MTAFPAAMRPRRFPVQRDLDGDFTLAGLARVSPDTGPIPRILRGQVEAYQHQLWRLDLPIDDNRLLSWARPTATPVTIGEPSASDLALMRAFEVCGLWRPPVSHNVLGLSAPRACVWLAIADRWVLLSQTSGDLRFLNTACKLVGAVWTRWHAAAGNGWTSVAGPLAHTARLVSDATRYLTGRMRQHPLGSSTAAPSPAWPKPAARTPAPSVVVLAGTGSAGAQQFLTALPHPSPVAAVCWYDAPGSAIPDQSAYSSAWYPPDTATAVPAGRVEAQQPGPGQYAARGWDDVASIIRHHRADLVVLIGMPIVPAPVLSQARLGVINAHNGALPRYRGMDAVGWAVLNNDPIVATVHLAAPAVDQGDTLAARTVPYRPPASLRSRVKAAQLDLLQAVTLQAVATGQLPVGIPQGPGRQYYRLHPHLKRVLDTWNDNLAERK